MKRLLAIALLTTLAASAEQGLRSGHATAQWLVTPHTVVPVRASFQTVVRLQVDKDWHVYWLNPGQAGMPTSVELKLPDGWQGDGLAHPVPKKFKTGELHGFGHEGTVDYLLNLKAPEDFKGDAELEATVSWLTCNDDSCVPGEITLKLKVVDFKVQGAKVIGPEEYKFVAARFPVEAPRELKFRLEDGKDHWELIIENPDLLKLNPGRTEVFIETQELVPATATVKFQPEGKFWVARCPKGEFALEFPDECAILLVQEGEPAVRVEWKRGE